MGEFVNSNQLRFTQSPVSCGVLEVHHFPDHTGSKLGFSVANALYNKANPRPAAFLLFSDVVESKDSRGQRLAVYLEKVKAGIIRTSETVINPKTGNSIRVWLVQINHDIFRTFYKEELANRLEIEE